MPQPCPHCGAELQRRGLRLFLQLPCPACGVRVRVRDSIDRFDLLEPLAGSGLGMIVRARDRESGEEVALKLFHPPPGTRPEDLGTFVSAMRELIILDHPHILRIYAAGLEEGVPFVAREWLPGGSLAELLGKRTRLPEREVLALAVQVADALAAAEVAGVRHRDVEPGNLIFADAATIKVADFAQATFFDRASMEAGTVWGALPYVAPERFNSEPEDARSDIYALGATLFHALTGEAPFGGETQGEALAERLANEATHVDRAALVVHPLTAAALEKMLALNPTERPRHWLQAQELLQRAERALPPPLAAPPPSAQPPPPPVVPLRPERSGGWATVVMAALIVVGVGGAAWQKWEPHRSVSAEPAQEEEIASPEEPAAPLPLPAATSPAAAAPVRLAPDPEPALPPPPAPPRFDFTGWTTAKLDPASTPNPVAGETTIAPDAASLRMTGSNDGVGGNRDAVAFHHRQLTGDWTLTARVMDVKGGVAGLMMRHDLELSTLCLALTLGEDGAVTAKVRLEPNTPAVPSPPISAARPCWLKLTRRSAVFSAEHSTDGKTWRPSGSLAPPNSPASVAVGFITHALTKPGTASATFDQLSLQALP